MDEYNDWAGSFDSIRIPYDYGMFERFSFSVSFGTTHNQTKYEHFHKQRSRKTNI